MKNNNEYIYDEETKIAKVILYYKNQRFIGKAICHPEDTDFASKYTGLTIAEDRALIKALCFHRDYEILPALAALKQLYNSINKSKLYDKKHYEARMLLRQINMYEEDLQVTRSTIKEIKNNLAVYIHDKDITHKTIKKIRDRAKEDNQI